MSATETKPSGDAKPSTEFSQEGFRVYVGNLPYSATEEQVKEFMAKAGSGEILSVALPTKFGRRPAGYAFVAYKNEADANSVVEKLNDSDFGDRKVALQIARGAEETAERRKVRDEERKAARAARPRKEKPAGEATEGAVDGEAKDVAAKPKKARKPRRRAPEEGGEDEAAGESGAAEAKPKNTRKPREARIDEDGNEIKPAPRERRERQPKLQLSDKASESTVFVANLPFDVDDDALAAIFTNLSIRVKKATVVRGLRKGRGGRPFRASRGFGFVEIEDPAQQKEAVQKVEGTLIGERAISAKIANEMKPIEVEETINAGESGAVADNNA